MAQAAEFLSLFGTEFTFQTFDDDDDRKSKNLAFIRHGDLARHGAELVRANAARCGVFFTVNETDGRGREAKNVVRVRALFVDLDGAPLDPVLDAPLPPHVVVESGGEGRYHAYWPSGSEAAI